MSYQIPDLLTFLTSVLNDDDAGEDDGDLHMNPSYPALSDNDDNDTIFETLFNLFPPQNNTTILTAQSSSSSSPPSKLQKSLRAFLREYNPDLLASLYLPFPSTLKMEHSNGEVMAVVREWLAFCAVMVEETVRPGRVVGFDAMRNSRVESEMDGGCIRERLEAIVRRISRFSYSSPQTMHESINDLLHAFYHPPPRPQPHSQPRHRHHTHSSDDITTTQYLSWRVALCGHRLLSHLFIPPSDRGKYKKAVDLALEISVCVNDMFAYNIHQAWHSTHPSSSCENRSHLNLVSFLLRSGEVGGDPGTTTTGTATTSITLQSAINVVGDMIRQRMIQLKTELKRMATEEGKSGQGKGQGAGAGEERGFGMLSNIFSSFFGDYSSSSSNDNNNNASEERDEDTDTMQRSQSEIRKTLWNWVSGTIHWAYEVEYFAPNLENSDEGEGGGKRKKGGEIRDYGWVFLIQKEML